MYHQPFTSEFARVLGGLVGEALASLGTPAPKVLAVDADNTLWGGIVGEDGADGITIGDSFPGNGFRALQQGLVYQAATRGTRGAGQQEQRARCRRGLRPSFRRHGARPRAPRCSAGGLEQQGRQPPEHREELNLGLDSFVFIDDNEVELDEVRQRLPGVQVVKVSDEPSDIAQLTASLTGFRFATVSKEDRERTAMVQVEADRMAAASEAPSQEDFLASLGLTVRVGRARPRRWVGSPS